MKKKKEKEIGETTGVAEVGNLRHPGRGEGVSKCIEDNNMSMDLDKCRKIVLLRPLFFFFVGRLNSGSNR